MALAHGKLWVPGNWEGSRPCFFYVKKSPGKDGEKRTAKLKWLDEYCNKCGNQINSWDVRLSMA